MINFQRYTYTFKYIYTCIYIYNAENANLNAEIAEILKPKTSKGKYAAYERQ